ncbi:N-acetyltransferase [Mesonia sediminis]|jgi:hypothetical protein|uniref:N-acetyltransferase n=1 Tax=Mesonia sediminis TaxID=1703946 RepID=A0ABW5SIX7_9FLAO
MPSITAPLKDNEFIRQFEAQVDQVFIAIEYSKQERKIFLSRLHQNPPEGLTTVQVDAFLEQVFDYVRSLGRLKIVPTGKEVARFFKARKKQYDDLIPMGMSL